MSLSSSSAVVVVVNGEKGVAGDCFDVAATAEDQRLVAGISDMFYRRQLD